MQRLRAKVAEWAEQNHLDQLQDGLRCWLGSRTPNQDNVQEALLFALVAANASGDSLLELYQNSQSNLARFERDTFAVWDKVVFSVFEMVSVDGDFRVATPEEESKGIDGFVNGEFVSVKPVTYKQTINSKKENINVPIIYYKKGKNKGDIEIV